MNYVDLWGLLASEGHINWNAVLDGVQAGLDVAGLVPGFGELADGVNALISLGRGDVAGAALSAASMLPIVGDAIGKGGKVVRAVTKHGDEVLEAAGKVAGSKATSKMTKPYATSRPSYGKGQVEQVWENAKDAIIIGGREYSKHALERMEQRKIVPMIVEETIKRGVQIPGKTFGTTIYLTDEAKVILNESGKVITVMAQ